MLEHRDKNKANKAHSYEVTKIELYDPKDGKSDSSWRSMVGENPSIEAANLLKDVEKSYDSGKKLIDESEKSTYFRKNEGNLTPQEIDFAKKEEAGRKLAKKLNSDFEAITELDQIQNKEVCFLCAILCVVFIFAENHQIV